MEATASYDLTVTSAAPSFLGLISYGGTQPITSGTLTALTSPASLLPTAEEVIVGVPEPSTFAGLAMAGVCFALAHRLRLTPAAPRVLASLAIALVGTLSAGWQGMHVVAHAADRPGRPATPSAAKAPAQPAHEVAIAKAVELRAAAKPEEALDVLRLATRAVKTTGGDKAPDLLPIYELAADILVETGQVEKTTTLLEKALDLHRSLHADGRHPDPAGFGRTLLIEHRLHADERRIAAALDAARQAWLVLDAHAGPTASDSLRAAAAFEATLATFGEMLGSNHERTIAAREAAATLYESLGRLDEAVTVQRGIVGDLELMHGSAGGETRAATERLARLLLAGGRASEALDELEADGDADPTVTEAFRRLRGDLLVAVERFTEARAAYEGAVNAAVAAFGADHPTTLLDRLALERVESRRGRPPRDEVLAECVAALRSRTDDDPLPAAGIAVLLAAAELKAVLGDESLAREWAGEAVAAAGDHPEIPAALRIAALLAAAPVEVTSSDSEIDARDALAEVLVQAERDLGAGHPATLDVEVSLAERAIDAGNVAGAAGLVGRLLDHRVPPRDPAFEERLVRLVDRTAASLDEGGAALRDRLVTLRQTQFGDEDRRTALALALFGGARLAAGDPGAAAEYCRRALDIQSASLSQDHPDVAATRLVLAESLRATGRAAEARPVLEQALAIWDRSAGPRHEATLATVRGLARVALLTGDAAGATSHLDRLRAADADPAESDGTGIDAASRARFLARMGVIAAEAGQGDRARELVAEALALPCWRPAESADGTVLESLALSMAEMARVFRVLDDQAAATDAVRRARGYAMHVDNPRQLLARVDATPDRRDVAGDDL